MYDAHFNNNGKKKNSAFTMIELMIALTLSTFVFLAFGTWIHFNSRQQKKVTALSAAQQTMGFAAAHMQTELQTARDILHPDPLAMPSSDPDAPEQTCFTSNVLIFRNFTGDIIFYYYDKGTRTLKRHVIAFSSGISSTANIKKTILAKDIDKVLFTILIDKPSFVKIYMESNGYPLLDSAYLLNS
ncbi:MAG: type II secretion system protein [Candidatus Riflebacteria bacterium]|nr:type II secretion system protein [Candidatus Riflebacteria bacterium]